MPIPPKKLKALVDEDKTKGKRKPSFPPKKGNPGEKGEDDLIGDDEIAKKVEAARKQVERDPDDACAELVAGFSGEGTPDGADEDKWETASEMVGPDEGDPDHWLVVAHVYKDIGGTMPESGEIENADEEEEDENVLDE